MLSLSFSGTATLVVPETCDFIEESAETDCAPTCVLCGCCAQPVVVSMALLVVAAAAPRVLPTGHSDAGPTADSREILHVPKPRRA
jgi:hypothetical protein